MYARVLKAAYGKYQFEKYTSSRSDGSLSHLLKYILEAGTNLMASRVFWLLMVIASASTGIHWSKEVSYSHVTIGNICVDMKRKY